MFDESEDFGQIIIHSMSVVYFQSSKCFRCALLVIIDDVVVYVCVLCAVSWMCSTHNRSINS